MLVTVLWVTAVSNLVEIGENDRMRWEIEPVLAIWAATLAAALRRRSTLLLKREKRLLSPKGISPFNTAVAPCILANRR
jgi:hypothetical protein